MHHINPSPRVVNDDGDCNCIGSASGAETIDSENFELDWGIWNDGGADARRNIIDFIRIQTDQKLISKRFIYIK